MFRTVNSEYKRCWACCTFSCNSYWYHNIV